MPDAAPPVTLRNALVIDDHPLFCDALSMTLRLVAGVDSVRVASDLHGAIALLECTVKVEPE